MHPPTDMALLRRWQVQRDAHAFKALTQRYGGMVFSACNRVLKNASEAEDITQECFLKLALHPDGPQRSVGPWLHSVAVRTSINRIRSEQRRRDREASYEAERPASATYNAGDLMEHVDGAIDQLPVTLRTCIVGHFLSNRPQSEIAKELGVSTRTVRRKTDEAIAQVRAHLLQRGIGTSTGMLTVVFSGLGAEAIAPALSASLGKIAVGGSGPATGAPAMLAAGKVVSTGGIFAMKSMVLTIIGVGLGTFGLLWALGSESPDTAVSGGVANVQGAMPENTVGTEPDPVAPGPEAVPVAETGASNSDVVALVSATSIPTIANPTRYATLGGHVQDEGGQPVGGARVVLAVAGLPAEGLEIVRVPGYPNGSRTMDENLFLARQGKALELALSAPGHQYEATTGDDGDFLIEHIRYAGEARVLAIATDLAMYPVATQLEENERHDMRLTLRPAKTIHGRVVAPDGAPITGATVASISHRSFSTGPNGEIIGSGSGGGTPVMTLFRPRTDENGEFHLTLADADYAALVIESDTHGGQAFPEVPVGSGFLETIQWTSNVATLEGQIRSDGDNASYYVHLAGALMPQADATTPKATVPSGTSGTRRSGGSSSSGKMKSGTSGSSRSSKGGGITRGGSGGGSFGGPGGGGSFGGGGFGGGSATPGGRATSGPATTAGRAALTPLPSLGTDRQIETDAEGRFEVSALPAGESYTVTIYDAAGRKVGATALPPLEPNETTPWTYTLEPPLRVTGRVVGIMSGEGLANMLVRARPSGSSTPFSQMDATRTTAEGAFTLDLFHPEGAYDIMPVVDANAPILPDVPYSMTLDLRQGEPQAITLQLPEPWSCRIRVTDGHGAPLPGASVVLHQQNADGSGFSSLLPGVTSDQMGYITLDGLSGDAEVQAQFSKQGYLPAMSAPRKAGAGQTAAVETIALFADASATARVVDASGAPLPNRDLLCTAYYGQGREDVLVTRSDGEGWVVLQECLPATVLDLEFRLTAPPKDGTAFGGFGEMPPHIRAKMAARDARRAVEAGTPAGQRTGLRLADGTVNELGTFVLE